MHGPGFRSVLVHACVRACVRGADNQDAFITAVAKAAAAKKIPVTVVVMGGGPVDISASCKDNADVGAIMWCGYPGQVCESPYKIQIPLRAMCMDTERDGWLCFYGSPEGRASRIQSLARTTPPAN